MLGRCDPPQHAWDLDGDGVVSCQCGETTVEKITADDGTWTMTNLHMKGTGTLDVSAALDEPLTQWQRDFAAEVFARDEDGEWAHPSPDLRSPFRDGVREHRATGQVQAPGSGSPS